MSYTSVFRPDLFIGQTIVVTGGGSGIGRCTAHELASLGAHVFLVGRTVSKLERVCAEIVEDGGQASFAPCDIRGEPEVTKLISTVLEQRGALHALVNNAGGQFPAPLVGINKKGWDAVVATNLTGGFLMAREAYTQHMGAHGGVIVNLVADMWRGMPGMGHSGASRAGMVNFTKTAAVEWASSGVRVNAVAPGFIASSGMDTYPDSIKAHLAELPRAVPLKRMGTEEEVSAAIVYLLSPAAAYVTGQTLSVDGGSPLYPTLPLLSIPEHGNSTPYRGFHRGAPPELSATPEESD